MQQQMFQLESEIARLQIEIRQVRQLIGSLIRHEQETSHMMNRQLVAAYPNLLSQQFVADQMAQGDQYNTMRQLADTMNGTIQSFSQMTAPGPSAPNPLGVMSPRGNDPVQRNFQ